MGADLTLGRRRQWSGLSGADWLRALRGDAVSVLERLSLPPFPYRVGVDRVMAVGIEPQATSEARLPRELVFGHTLDEVDEPPVGVVLLRQDIGERHVSFPLGHHGIERVDATVGH